MIINQPLELYFDTLSKTYKANEYASFFITNYMRRKLVKKVSDYNNKSVLDIMSGQGENLKYIGNNYSEITTLDFAPRMNKNARLIGKMKKVTQIEADFFKVNHKKTYDVILCSYGVKTINSEKVNLFTRKVNNLLKPNGEILLLEMVRPKQSLTYKFIKFYLESVVPKFYGEQFKLLFPYVDNHVNMNNLKINLIDNKLTIIEHRRFLDLFEIIHAKKPALC